MVAVHIFVIFIKNYMIKEKRKKYNGGEIHFGLEVLLFVLVIFVIWVLMGGAKKRPPENPLLKPGPGEIIPKGAF